MGRCFSKIAFARVWCAGALLYCVGAFAACPAIRVGYTDQLRPPFFLGVGATVAEPPGMGVELIRSTFKAFGCPVTLKRYPPARLVSALRNGDVDFSIMGMSAKLAAKLTFPSLADGNLDRSRALHLKGVVYVRATDALARSGIPAQYFRTHLLGGVKELQILGEPSTRALKLDFGAADIWANLEKLRVGRIDGAMAALFDERGLDDMIFVRYGPAIVRLPEPLIFIDLTLATNGGFYKRNPVLVERTWDRIRDRWPAELAALMESVQRADDDNGVLSPW